MARELLNKDGSPMREYHSEIIEKLLNEPKQTAVEWLVSKLPQRMLNYLEEEIKQAKEMEKQQIMKAVYDAMGTNFDPNMGRAEQYYNETYNK